MTWFFLFFKRNFKHLSFVVLLLLIPFFAFTLNLLTKTDDSIFKIGYTSSAYDELLLEFFESLEDSDNIAFVETDDINALKKGEIDALCIFNGNFKEKLAKGEGVAEILLREENEVTDLLIEKLFCVIYPYFSESFFEGYMKNNVEGAESLSQTELKDYYSYKKLNTDVVSITAIDKDEKESSDTDNFIFSAIRGILSLLVILSALSSALFTLGDEKRGIFALNERKLYLFCAAILSGLLPTSAVYLISVKTLGIWQGFLPEMIGICILITTSLAFSLLLCRIFRTLELFSTIIPAVTVASLIVSPIFLNVSSFPVIQMLFPSYYYLYSFVDSSIYLKALAYVLSGIVISCVLEVVKEKKMLTKNE